VHKQSRGIRVALDLAHHTARLVREYDHRPSLLAGFEGNVQTLPGGHEFVGWGQQPFFTEYDARGRVLFDAHFNAPTASYRAYRLPWNGQPSPPPSIAASKPKAGAVTVYASWNGTTATARWEVLSGPSATSLKRVAVAARRGFETAIRVRATGPVFAVQALGSAGQVLARSPAVRVG
jgi:hypothetical protein